MGMRIPPILPMANHTSGGGLPPYFCAVRVPHLWRGQRRLEKKDEGDVRCPVYHARQGNEFANQDTHEGQVCLAWVEPMLSGEDDGERLECEVEDSEDEGEPGWWY